MKSILLLTVLSCFALATADKHVLRCFSCNQCDGNEPDSEYLEECSAFDDPVCYIARLDKTQYIRGCHSRAACKNIDNDFLQRICCEGDGCNAVGPASWNDGAKLAPTTTTTTTTTTTPFVKELEETMVIFIVDLSNVRGKQVESVTKFTVDACKDAIRSGANVGLLAGSTVYIIDDSTNRDMSEQEKMEAIDQIIEEIKTKWEDERDDSSTIYQSLTMLVNFF